MTIIFFQGLCVLGCPSAICCLKTSSKWDGAERDWQPDSNAWEHRNFISKTENDCQIQLTIVLENPNCCSWTSSTIHNWVVVQWITNYQSSLSKKQKTKKKTIQDTIFTYYKPTTKIMRIPFQSEQEGWQSLWHNPCQTRWQLASQQSLQHTPPVHYAIS